MTSSSLPPDSGDDLPIDAEFEPAAPKSGADASPGKGPGWAAFGGLGLIALAGFVLAAASAGLIPGFQPGAGKVSDLETRIDAFEAAQSGTADQATNQAAEIAALKGRADSLRADRTRTVTDMRALRDEIDAIQADLAALQRARVATLAEEASDGDSPGTSASLAALETRIAALEDALVSQLDGYNLALDLLKSRLDALEEKAGSETLTATAANNNRTESALALSAIEAAARRGRPFLSAHQRLAAAMPGNDAVASLASVASKAVPTRSDLTAALPPLIDEALDREAQSASGGSGWMRSVFGDGIQVRRKDAVTTRDHLDLARTALDGGELAETIEHIRAIDADLQPVFTDWVQNAEDRHLLEETLEALRLTMIAEERP
ncbi:MAG: hypothetical protein NXH78_10025 [Hyphomonadaceae bacterium]|nr:hypothetical protein [Hyphomonadaceae bacterium]